MYALPRSDSKIPRPFLVSAGFLTPENGGKLAEQTDVDVYRTDRHKHDCSKSVVKNIKHHLYTDRHE